MNSDRIFWVCIVISLGVHAAAFWGLPGISKDIKKSPERNILVEVTYLSQDIQKVKVDKTLIKPVSKKTVVEKKEIKIPKKIPPEVKKDAALLSKPKKIEVKKNEAQLVKVEKDKPKPEKKTEPEEKKDDRVYEVDLQKISDSDEFIDYYEAIRAKIKQVVIYPPEASSRGLEGLAGLRFCINRHGELIEAELIHSARHNSLDWAALRSIKEAAPFPPFPEELKRKFDKLSFNTEVFFQLN